MECCEAVYTSASASRHFLYLLSEKRSRRKEEKCKRQGNSDATIAKLFRYASAGGALISKCIASIECTKRCRSRRFYTTSRARREYVKVVIEHPQQLGGAADAATDAWHRCILRVAHTSSTHTPPLRNKVLLV